MEQHLIWIADKLWPDLAMLERPERKRRMAELVGVIYGSFLMVVGLSWTAARTDLGVLRVSWPILLCILLLAVLLNLLPFFWIIEPRAGIYDSWSSTLAALATASAMLLFGPTAIWVYVVASLIFYAYNWRGKTVLVSQRWNILRNLALNVGTVALGAMIGLTLYQQLGGRFPLPGLAGPDAARATLAILVALVIDLISWTGYLLLVGWLGFGRTGAPELRLFLVFEIIAFIPDFFAIFAAAVYSQMGIGGYLTLMASALLVGLLAYRLSLAVERSQQRSRELAQLEELSRAIIAAPPDAATLPDLLARFVPRMFRHDQIEVRNLDHTLLRIPAQVPPIPSELWDWLYVTTQPHAFRRGEVLPWNGQPATRALAVAPMVNVEAVRSFGGICVVLSLTVEDPGAVLPALQSLAASIASELYSADMHRRVLEHQVVTQELAMARQIQAGFLPASLPQPPGWQLTAALQPARETSGDFYDVGLLPNGQLGLLIADVADKGIGAALFMALSRTIIRTYAFENPIQPEEVLQAANWRILVDSRSSMFVTVFYGILDPASGTLTYCNAGHNPPYLFSDRAVPQPLRNTGIPLGVLEEATWEAQTINVQPGDMLVLYTDGISEAHNQNQELFDVPRLLAAVQAHRNESAQAVQDAILTAVGQFVGEAPQFDDLTLMVLTRDREQPRDARNPLDGAPLADSLEPAAELGGTLR